MTNDPPTARMDLLRRLLEAHERSSSFGRAAPWPRDVIVRVDSKNFPQEFAPDGRTQFEALRDAIHHLVSAGACRAAFDRFSEDGIPREVRLGPAEVERAYAVALDGGFEPLSVALAGIKEVALALLAQEAPGWMRSFLECVVDGVANADASWLGMSRERMKREWRDVADALRAAAAISPGVDTWERMLSERVFARSKRLGSLRSLVVQVLLRADPRWEGVDLEDAVDLLETYCWGAGRMMSAAA